MKKIFLIIATAALAIAMLASCDEGVPEEPQQFDGAAWDAVFSTGLMNNATLTYTVDVEDGQFKATAKNEAEGFYIMTSTPDGNVTEGYCEHKNGHIYEYASVGGEWIKERLDEHKMAHNEMMRIIDLSGHFEGFTLDKASGEYTAESVSVDDDVITNVAVRIVDGRLDSIRYTLDGDVYTVSYKDYGVTDVSFPDAKLSEGEGGDFELPIIRK